MTTVTATPAQRIAARDKCAIATAALWPVAQNSYTPAAAEGAVIDATLLEAANALGALGSTAALPATQVVVSNAQAITMQNSAGTAIPGTHPATVAGGVLTNVKLASTVGVVVNAVKQSGWTVTGTGTFFTPTIVAGVCTGGVLSAS